MRSKLARTGSLASSFLNVWLFNGNPDESISARAYREGEILGDPTWHKRRVFIDNVWQTVFFTKKHCIGAYLLDVDHAKGLIDGTS